MTALHANGVGTVVVEKLDRLSRNLMVQETIIADFGRTAVNSRKYRGTGPDGKRSDANPYCGR
jgi:DNA invertase Pin-like site-specific DNA recombinase